MGAIRKRQRWGIALGAAIAALVAVGAAYAITSTSFTYSKTKTGYVTIGPLAFSPTSDGRTWSADETGLTTSGGCFGAAVSLPEGSKVKSVQFFVDNQAGLVQGELERTNMATGNGETIGFVQILNPTLVIEKPIGPVPSAKQAVGPGYSYGLLFCLAPGDTLYGAKVKYTYTSAGS